MALIAHWPLNGNTNDISGNEYNLTNNGATFVSGKIGQAANFESTNSQYMSGPINQNLYVSNSPFTLSFWVYLKSLPTLLTGLVGFNKYYTETEGGGFGVGFKSTGALTFIVGDKTNTTEIDYPAANFPLNKWHHISMKFDGLKVYHYLNGQMLGSVNRTLWRANNVALLLALGTQGGWGNYSNIILNDIRLFNHSLSDLDIQEIARAKILHYTFDDMQEPTTNITTGIISNYGGATSYSNGTSLFQVTRVSDSIVEGPYIYSRYTGTINSSNNQVIWQMSYRGTADFSKTFTVSAFLRGSGTCHFTLYDDGTSYKISPDFTLTNTWTKYTYTGTFSGTYTTNHWVALRGILDTTAVDISSLQIEEKPYATEFVVGSRSAVIRDYSEFYNDSQIVTIDGYGYKVDHIDQYGTWVKIFNHDYTAGGLFTSDAEAAYNSPGDPTNPKFSILNKISNFLRTDSKYKFEIYYPETRFRNIWYQTSDPNTQTIAGYSPISIAGTVNGWGGLEPDTSNSTYLDGSVGTSTWFYSIGSQVLWGIGIPGPGYGVTKVQLYICIENTQYMNNYPRWVSESKIGTGAYQFNGSNSVIERPMLSQLGYNSFTVNMWAWFDESGVRDVMFGNFSAGNNFNFEKLTSNNLRFYWNASPDISTGNVIPIGEWCMLTAVRERINNTTSNIKMYVNGISVYNQSHTAADLTNLNGTLRLGRDYRTTTEAMKGKLDDVRVYMEALSDKDIRDLYEARAEIEQSGVLYARGLVSNAEETINLVPDGMRTCEIPFTQQTYSGEAFAFTQLTNTQGRENVTRIYINPTVGTNPYALFGFKAFKSGGSNIGDVYAISFDYKVVKGIGEPSLSTAYANGYKLPDSTNAATFGTATVTTLLDGWKRFRRTATITIAGETWWRTNLFSNNVETDVYLDNFQIELKGYSTPFTDGYRPASQLPSTIQFGANEIHETGTANFEDFSTVGITDGLVGYWQLDDNAKDYSGNNYNGTVSNAVSYGEFYRFNGATSSIQLPDEIISTQNIRSNGLTIIAKAKQTINHNGRIFVMTQATGYSDAASGGIGVANGYARAICYDDNIEYKYADATTPITNNQWFHIVGTYNPVDSKLRVYFNGVEEGNGQVITTYSRLITNAENSIGVKNPAAYWFNGDIAYVKLFNRTLTAEEIAIEYNTMFNNEVQVSDNGILYAKDIKQY